MDQQQVLHLLAFALYFLVGMAVFAARRAAKGDPGSWTPSGMLRRLREDAQRDRDLDEGMSSYPVAAALVIAVTWVAGVLVWPLLLVRWAWTSATRRSSGS